MERLWIFSVPLLLLAGCALTAGTGSRKTEAVFSDARIPLSSDSLVRDALYQTFGDWKKVGYRRGGLSKEGVDCSGFVHLAYRGIFGIDLPRNTKDQARLGKRVPRRSLRPGDLVFFRTGIFSMHVGIYLERSTFLHVSKRKGVTLSRLDNRYWSRRYWLARRVTAG